MSIGLAMQPEMGPLLITDPSPAFCRIVQNKLKEIEMKAESVDIAVLSAEDVSVLPAGSVSLILLRSVLHHITDVDGFLRSCAQVLPPGGLLVCEEPYYEGYMMMGFISQFMEDALANTGYTCTAEDRERIGFFTATMQFYCRRDVDKSTAEDKHLFRPDELMVSGRAVDLELTHFPNWRFTCTQEQNERGYRGHFYRFFSSYIEACMSWPSDFSRRVAEAVHKYFEFFSTLEAAGQTTPHCFGTFVFRKTG
jgi:2-polyprenyl-3-methyl-5-hydroxy-6-metoxy-1,4-benzoquinol methylase